MRIRRYIPRGSNNYTLAILYKLMSKYVIDLTYSARPQSKNEIPCVSMTDVIGIVGKFSSFLLRVSSFRFYFKRSMTPR